MTNQNQSFTVNVAPEMQLYRILQKQSYGEETALSEFVDNSIQSFIDNKEHIKQMDGEDVNLNITITINTNQKTITIEDDAAGISRDRLQQAIKMGRDPNQQHANSSLSIYGMGLKSAAIWFSDTWKLETSVIDSNEKLSLLFDLNRLLQSYSSEVEVILTKENNNAHYTKITIFNHSRKQDEDYYKNTVLPFLLETFVKFPNVNIKVIHDNLMLGPIPSGIFLDPNPALYLQKINSKREIEKGGNKILWKKDIDFQYNGKRVYGFIILMQRGSYKQPGIRLLRNKRVISGTSIHRNLPKNITGTINKYGAQRIYGEIHLNDFIVNYQKTGFDEDLTIVYEKIKTLLLEEPNLIKQASNFRARLTLIDDADPQDAVDRQPEPKLTPPPPPPIRPEIPNKIQESNEIKAKLGQSGNNKLLRLYYSLCTILLSEHPILLYVGSWSFLESISTAMGKPANESFEAYLKGKSNQLYRQDRNKKNDVNQVINDIHKKGNCNKHSSVSAAIDARQLANDFEVLEQFILYCLDQMA